MPAERPDLLAQTLAAAQRDRQTVTAGGDSLVPLLHGMSIHRSRTHTDDRGTLTEMLDPRWGWHPDPLVYAYCITERPWHVKGGALHKEHEDRYFLISGELELVTYDVRPDSPTCGRVCRLALSERDHFIVPHGSALRESRGWLGLQPALVDRRRRHDRALRRGPAPTAELHSFLHKGNKVPASCVVHRGELLERYGYWSEQRLKAGDWDLWRRMVEPPHGTNIDYQPVPTCLHFRAAWKSSADWGPTPLSSWLKVAQDGWWPKALRLDVPAGALP